MARPLSRDQWLYCLRFGLAVSIACGLSHGSDPSGALYAILGAGPVGFRQAEAAVESLAQSMTSTDGRTT